MSIRPANKSECLIAVRKELTICPKCKRPFDSVEANSHKTSPNDPNVRIYFQFLHGEEECIDFTMLNDFPTWFEKAKVATTK